MTGKPAERTQVDDLQDVYSDMAIVDTTGEPDMARQEFKNETDTNWILKQFGVPQQRRPVFTDTNFDLDLQQAIQAVADAKYAYKRLPDHLKANYRTWLEVLAAIDAGELTTLEPPKPPPDPAPAPVS